MTSTDGIKIVLCEGVKKGGCSRTQQRDREEKGVPAVRRLSSDVLVRRVELRLMFWELAVADLGVEGVGAEVGMATAEEIKRAGSIVRVFGGFEVRVGSSGKS
jgi:hypothetical protein